MIKYLLNRPIAVIMSFAAFFIIGVVTYFSLPISLLPDIAIPKITVQISVPNTSAREIENVVVKSLRQQLIQIAHLQDLSSHTRDASSVIRLSFDYGTNTDLAFIEVNEKIDAAMNFLPKEIARPRVVKASATDIPVFYLNLTLKNDNISFLELCDFADNSIRRRLEQLSEVAMVDITGMTDRQLLITPDIDKMMLSGLTISDIEDILIKNNVEPGSMTVRDGYYEYKIKFSTLLRTDEDVKNIILKKNGHLIRLGDICDISIAPVKEKGLSIYNGKNAIVMAVIKQSDKSMNKMKDQVDQTIKYFQQVYPDIEFNISQNQTTLLDYTINNLKQNLLLGFLFIFLVSIIFLGDIQSPLIICISMIVSIMMSFMFFYFFRLSLNIVSLSGLILALGMMIDNSIIVTENISQYRERGLSLINACISGTNEVIAPMLSSSLTTIAVFIPLVFVSGIAGTIFSDQAFSVTIGLLVSYFVGILLLPVLYMLIYKVKIKRAFRINIFFRSNILDRFYDKGLKWVFANKKLCLAICVLSIPLCIFMFIIIGKERMPYIDRNDLIAHIEWNENIHLLENKNRIDSIFNRIKPYTIEYIASIGHQDYILNRDEELSVSEANVYLQTENSSQIDKLEKIISNELSLNYPHSIVTFSPPPTVFEKIFVTGEPDIIAQLYARNKSVQVSKDDIQMVNKQIKLKTQYLSDDIAFDNQMNISINHEKLLLYNISYEVVYQKLRAAFKDNNVTVLHSSQQYLPVNIVGKELSIDQILHETLVNTNKDENGVSFMIPLKDLINVYNSEDLKTLTAGNIGEYIPLNYYKVDKPVDLMNNIKQIINEDKKWDLVFKGSFFSNQRMFDELIIILLISMLLMYFIMAAQFESFIQPLVVLIEIPIDLAFAMVVLWLCGQTLNLMSAIGLVVTCGIIINDSILKLDAIKALKAQDVSLLDAIHEAGKRRLRPIIMTSLTTIFAMIPLLFSFDMGSELQKPLAIAMIATMFIGTLVSLFFIPLVYWIINSKKTL